jgi:hypothetical protein
MAISARRALWRRLGYPKDDASASASTDRSRNLGSFFQADAAAVPIRMQPECVNGQRPGTEDLRMAAFLRVYPPSTQPQADRDASPATVSVNLGDLLPLLALAERKNYLWLQDFLDDQVAISEDLYEVLCAFRYTRPSA